MSTDTTVPAPAGPHHPHAHAPGSGAHGSGPEVERRRPWTVLGLMLAAQFMVVLDVSVVNVALPSIGSALDFGSADYQWAVSAYVLLSGGLLLLGGRISDLFDRRRAFVTGLTLFTIASLVSGLADSALMLILSRAAQGAGAAILTPAAMSIVMTTYAGRQRATALAVWGTVASMGIAAGVLFGGLLTTTLGWRAVFFINVPIGLLTVALTLRTVARGTVARGTVARGTVARGTGTSRSIRRLDVPGALTAVGGLVALVYAVERTHSSGWSSIGTLSWFAASAVLLTAFAVIERRVSAPLVPPHMWRIRSLVSASTVMAGVTGAVVGAIFLTSLYLQQVLGSSAIVAGLEFLPLALVITASAAVASKLLPLAGPRTLIAVGLVVAAAGALVLSQVGADSGYLVDVLPGFALLGLGVGPMFVAISVGAMSDVPPESSGLASGLMMTGHEVGAALGVAVVAAVGGDLTTRAGLIAGYPQAFLCVAGILVALLVPTLLAVPRRVAQAAG